jgi:aminoglycoside 6'-N-acetyltransferase
MRPATDSDIAPLADLASHPDVARWWGDNDEGDIRMEICAPRAIAWAVEVDGALTGLVVATEENDPDYRSVELDLFLAGERLGQGLGADALRTALRYLFEQRGHHRAVIGPDVENARAIRCYERVGFRPVGVLRQAERIGGRWRDVLVMDLLASELR